MQGWIKLHRKIAENPIWMSEPFTDGQALVDLILLANHKDGLLKVRGIRLQVKRGQVGWSELKLAERWQWSRGKVRRFLKHLEVEKVIKIEQQKNKVTSLYTIINYRLYQSNGTTNDTTDGQQTVQQTDTNKNEENKENGNITWRTDFDFYKKQLRESFIEIMNDNEWITKQERLNPGVDVKLSMEKACTNFWATEAGWKKKKSKRDTQNIDWKATMANAVTLSSNKVYKPRNEYRT